VLKREEEKVKYERSQRIFNELGSQINMEEEQKASQRDPERNPDNSDSKRR
jgi:hypothetical protein